MARRTSGPLTRPTAFWDSSALIPLCVHQSLTPRAITLYKTYEAVVWWATPIEIASALARLVRMSQIDTGDWTQARGLASNLADAWSVVQPSNTIKAKAVQFVESYDLHAADALQLAAATEWCEDAPQGRIFLTADRRLREAASLSGFDAQAI